MAAQFFNGLRIMTSEEREICAELFLAFTSDTTMPPHRWNDKAAVELYKMIRVLKNCSIGMSWIISLPVLLPTSGPAAARTALKYLYDIWKAKKKIDTTTSASGISPRCKDSYTHRFEWRIKAASMGL